MATSDPDEVLELMADEYAKEMLALLTDDRLSATEISDRLDAAESTVYDRLERLEVAGLVNEHLQVDPDGHHHHVYDARVDAVLVEIEDGGYRVRLQVTEDPADRIAQMWHEIRGE